ncbi:SH2 domain-containing protein 5-like isoform X2 [Ptychodera flava]|uniref:SH2 domain-containing protein 5-like isoform X2 n=1 Tax=Ptychodera flava TaxID=63121 RepID=UPI00396AA800
MNRAKPKPSNGGKPKAIAERRNHNVDRIRVVPQTESSPEQDRKVVDQVESPLISESAKRFCMYIGSFSVAHSTPSTRAEFIRLQLQNLREPRITKPVLLDINLTGIKVCNPEEENDVYMAHALKRISYSTCDPFYRQFAFLARNPNGPIGVQYCHVFLTRKESEAEEINAILGKAFKVAYASLRSKKRFSAMVADSNKDHFADFDLLGEISREAEIQRQKDLAKERHVMAKETDRELQVGQGRVWAKHIAGKAKHRTPYLEDVVLSPEKNGSPSGGKLKQQTDAIKSPNQGPSAVEPSAPPIPPGEERQEWDSAPRSEDRVQRSKPPQRAHKVEVDIDEIRRTITRPGDAPPLPPRSQGFSEVDGAVGGSFQDRRELHEENLLRNAPWFQAGIPREIAMEILQQDEVGAFVVRDSKSHPGCYALSLRVPKEIHASGIANYLIEFTLGSTYSLKGSDKDFPDLTTLIHYYSLNKELLPCRLNLARTNPIYCTVEPEDKESLEGSDDDVDDDPDYLYLSDFRSMMDEIQTM